MRCNYCGSNYGDLESVAVDLWKHGCYECGARDFGDLKPRTVALTSNSAMVYIPQDTSGSGGYLNMVGLQYGLGGYGGTGGSGECTISFEESRENEVYRAATGGSAGYFNGEYHDFSGFCISEEEYTQYEVTHYPGYPRSHDGWGNLPSYVPGLAESVRQARTYESALAYDKPRKSFIQRLFSGE